MNITRFLAATTLWLGASLSAHAAVIGFDDVGPNGTDFYLLSEDDFTVFWGGGEIWKNNTVYGAPAPFVSFSRRRSDPELWSGMFVKADDGGGFTFASVDLYSRVTQIPYRFIGYKDGTPVFDSYETAPNTFGLFQTAFNSAVDEVIDLLYIELVNPYLSFGGNPVGMDNIVVAKASEVPEPGSLVLVLMAISSLVAVGSMSKRPRAPR